MSASELAEFDWNNCILCQEVTGETLKHSAKNNNKDEVATTFNNTAFPLKDFSRIGKLPDTFHRNLPTLFHSFDLAGEFIKRDAKWHGLCKSKITQRKLDKCKLSLKRKTEKALESPEETKKTRIHTVKFDPCTCFIPECSTETSEQEPLHEVMSKELDDPFKEYAKHLNGKELLSKLAVGDLIALEAKYHSSCAVMYRKQVRLKTREQKPPRSHNIKKYEQYLESRYDTDSQTFVLSNLVKEYDSILKEILPEEFWPPSPTHSTR